MFYIVQFDSDILKDKTIVSSAWLNKHNTLCILPPAKTTAEIESLAQSRAPPKEGWQMYSVSTMQEFDTFSQAKDNLEKIKKAAAEVEEQQEEGQQLQQRKRKRPSFLSNYSESAEEEEDDDDDDDLEEEDLRRMVEEALNSSNEDIATNTDPLIVKVEPLAHSKHFGRRRRRRAVANHDASNVSFSSDVNVVDTKCPCNSGCHKTILRSIARIQGLLETNTRLLQQLVGSQSRTANNPHSLPKDFPASLPVREARDFEGINAYLEDDTHFAETLPYFTAFGGDDARQTFKRVMEALISYELGPTLNWKGRGGKIPFSSYTKIHSLVFSAIKQNPKAEITTLSDVERNIKGWLRVAPDRYGNRLRRKLEQEEKILRC